LYTKIRKKSNINRNSQARILARLCFDSFSYISIVETTRRVVSTGVSNDRRGFPTPHPVIASNVIARRSRSNLKGWSNLKSEAISM